MPPLSSRNITSDNDFTLLTLGSMALLRAGDPTPLLGPGKPVALLAYLLGQPARTASREHLVELLWADAEPERARHALRQTLWQLRQLLGDGAFSGKDEVTLDLAIGSDRSCFLGLIEAGDLEAATEVYAGPFVPSFASPGGASFEHWADSERDRLRTTFVRGMERLIRRHLAAGQPRAALAAARRLCEVGEEPMIGRRLAIESHLASGDLISASADADAFERWAREEEYPLDIPAKAVVQRVRAELDRDREGSGPPKLAHRHVVAELVGREAEFATALSAWNSVRARGSRHLHVVAPAGLGKSRLLHDLEARLKNSGGVVRYLRAHPGDRGLPGALVSELARALASLPGAMGVASQVAATLVGLDPSLANIYSVTPDASTGEEARRRRALALTELLRVTSDEAPFALLIDDLHWADPESFVLLESLLDRAEMSRALFVTATRPVNERSIRSEFRQTVALNPFTVDQVSQLLDSLGTREAESDLGGLAEQLEVATGGNPLLVLELLELASERGVLNVKDGRWRCTDAMQLTVLLQEGEGIRQRILRLGNESREVLLLLSIAGIPTTPEILAAASEADTSTVLQRLDLLERQGFVQRAGDSWETAHDEIADTALDAAGTAALTSRRMLAVALERISGNDLGSLARLASHYQAIEEVNGLARLVSRRIHATRRAGNTESSMQALHSLLGVHATPELERKIFRELPRRIRWRKPVAVAAGMIAVVVLGSVAARMGASTNLPDATFEVTWTDEKGNATVADVEVREDGWKQGVPLVPVVQTPRFTKQLQGWEPVRGLTFNSSGDTALAVMLRPGSSNEEVVMLTGDTLIWLTDDERDDNSPSFLPDGSGMVFLSARWSPTGDDDTDIAIASFGSPDVRRLTSTRDTDQSPHISPDGTRVGFVRQDRETGRGRACTITIDGNSLRCYTIVEYSVGQVVAWIDTGHLLVMAETGGMTTGVRVALSSGDYDLIMPGYVKKAELGASSGFVACICENPATTLLEVRIAPVGNPLNYRTVALPTNSVPSFLTVVFQKPSRIGLDTLTVLPPGTMAAGSEYLLEAIGWNREGRRVAFDTTTLRWSTADTRVATVNQSTGLLTAITQGETVLRVTAGGWRSDSVRVHIDTSRATTLLGEEWVNWIERWSPFGFPVPTVKPHPSLGMAFRNNGEGRHRSGVYTRSGFSSKDGLTVDLDLSTPINREKWQLTSIAFTSNADSTDLEQWDRIVGYPPGAEKSNNMTCGATFPGGEGEARSKLVALGAGHRGNMWVPPTPLGSGKPFRLRLSLFSDGRCGMAINGEPVAISSNRIRLPKEMRLWISGNSVDTDIAVGKVTVWQGDPGGVDWGKLSRPK